MVFVWQVDQDPKFLGFGLMVATFLMPLSNKEKGCTKYTVTMPSLYTIEHIRGDEFREGDDAPDADPPRQAKPCVVLA